jgi:hypothetical protein
MIHLPSVKDVYDSLHHIHTRAVDWPTVRQHTMPGDAVAVDVRLQIDPDGDWNVLWGDSQYDTDHRGYWGFGSILVGDEPDALYALAMALIDGVKDNMAEEGVA